MDELPAGSYFQMGSGVGGGRNSRSPGEDMRCACELKLATTGDWSLYFSRLSVALRATGLQPVAAQSFQIQSR